MSFFNGQMIPGLGANITLAQVDKKYNPNSENAQSGIAVNQAVQEMASALSVGMSRKIVNKLPPVQDAEENAIYMVQNNSSTVDNYYDEYLFIPTLHGVHSGITVTNASWEETETPFILKRAKCSSVNANDDFTVFNYTFKGWNINGIETTITFTLSNDTDINRTFINYVNFSSLYVDFTINSKTELTAKVCYLDDLNKPYERIGYTAVDLEYYATQTYVWNTIQQEVPNMINEAIGQALEGDY